jgi:PKD repeat protein/plastocyanin
MPGDRDDPAGPADSDESADPADDDPSRPTDSDDVRDLPTASISVSGCSRGDSRGTYLRVRSLGPTESAGRVADRHWRFGDDTGVVSATGPWASHVYESPGEYTITLTVTDRAGRTATDSHRVVVGGDDPVAHISAPERVGVGETVVLDGSGSRLPVPEDVTASYEWYDHGADRRVEGRSYERRLSEPGDHRFELTVRLGPAVADQSSATEGTATASHVVTAEDRTLTARVSAPDRIEAGEAVSLDASESGGPAEITSYEWVDHGRDRTVETDAYRCILPTAGDYRFELTVTDSAGTTATASHVVTAVANDPTARIAAPDRVGVGGTVTLDSGASDAPENADYVWTDHETGVEHEGRRFERRLAEPGTHRFGLRIETPDGRSDTASRTITVVEGGPTARIDAPDRAAVGESVRFDAGDSAGPTAITEYDWVDFEGDPLGVDSDSFSCTFGEPGRYRYRVRVTDGTGATDTASHVVVVRGGGAGPTADIAVARRAETPRGRYVVFENTGVPVGDDRDLTHQWDFGDDTGGATAVGPSASHVYDSPGTHTVELTVTDDEGRSDTASLILRVGGGTTDGPTARIDAPDRAAVGESVRFDASDSTAGNGGIVRFAWDDYDRPHLDRVGPDTDAFERTYPECGTYWIRLRVTDSTGATDSVRHAIRVIET